MAISKCFLCAPDPALIVTEFSTAYAMVGLGPITHTYGMIASREHTPSLADLALADAEAIDHLVTIRRRLEEARGPLLLTEHGRVPVCRDEDQHEAHCFHAHALFFGVGGGTVDHATSFYSTGMEFSEIGPALAYASDFDAYMLVSKNASSYEILSGPLNTPRQLARTLVAAKIGDIRTADWRNDPRKDAAEQMAASIRTALADRG